jgi:hypothetical protein
VEATTIRGCLHRLGERREHREKAKVAMGIARYEIRQPKKARRQTDQRIKQQDAQKKRRDEAEKKK